MTYGKYGKGIMSSKVRGRRRVNVEEAADKWRGKTDEAGRQFLEGISNKESMNILQHGLQNSL